MQQPDADLSPQAVNAVVESIRSTPIASIVTDNRLPDNPIIAANEAFLALTGYPPDEVIGRNCRFLAGIGTEPEAQRQMREAIERARPIVVELTNYRKNGKAFRNAVMVAPVLDETGRAALFVGSQMDVTDTARQGGLRQARARQQVAALTRRQRQVLKYMSAGYRNKQIGGELGIDEKTVKMHRARLFEALGVSASADAVRIAVEADLKISDPD